MASLPSNTFMFNYNAREYNSSTHTFPKTPGQQFNEDLVLNGGNPGSFDGESVNFTNTRWMGKTYTSTAYNPFNRSSSNTTFTFVYKTSGFTQGNQNLFANRGRDHQYMVRGNMFHTSQSGFLSLTPSTNPQIVFVRIQANGQSERKVVDANGNVLQSVSASSISWGGASNAVGFFSGYGTQGNEYFMNRFYWMYCSLEALTDAELKQVIAYNENTSTFETNITAITATYETTTSSVTLTAEEDMAWTASTSNDWITLSTTGGTGSSVFTVTLSKNKAYSARNGLVTLTNGEDIIEITVEQAKYPLFIPFENIYRADLEVVKGYRSGSTINKAYRSGELIYYKLGYSQPTPPVPPGPEETPLTFNILSAGTIYWKAQNIDTKEIQYSINDAPWVSITSTSAPGTPIELNTGDVIKFKGDGTISTGSSSYNTFSGSTAKFEVEGNIMSLIDSTGFTTATTLASSYTFYRLFYNCTGLTSAENLILPATTLADYCYGYMFYGCTSLTSAPALPATTLATNCYYNMFNGCTSLTSAPVLPATTLASNCYQSMFSGCTSLTTAPELPATTLASYCYQNMFAYCESLTTAPELPATTLADRCYQNMFRYCSLTTAPELPATTLAERCYQSMFSNCVSLTTAPELPAETLVSYCYYQMFQRCSSLNYIKCLATNISAGNCTTNWVSNVAIIGTFETPSSTNWSTGASGIPNGWTRVNA